MSDEARIFDTEDLRDIAESVQASVGPHFMCMVFVWPRKDPIKSEEIVQISQLDHDDLTKFLEFYLKGGIKVKAEFERRPER